MTKQYLRKIDPLDSLVKYVLDTKPYHTKIIEVLKEYIYEDEVFVTIDDKHWFADRLCKISNSAREEWTNEYQSIMPPEPIYQVKDPRTNKLVNFDFKTTKIIDYPDDLKPKWEWDDSDINKEQLPKQTNPRFNENGGAIFDSEKWCEYKGIEIHHPYQDVSENHCEIGYSTQPFGSTGRIDILSPSKSKSFIDYPAINPKTKQFCVTMDRTGEFKPGNKIQIQCDIEDFSNIDSIKEMNNYEFKIKGDKVDFYLNSLKDNHFYADGTNYKKKFIVKNASYDYDNDETTIKVFPSISETDKKNFRYIGIIVTPTKNNGIYTVKSSKFIGGTIDYFPDITNPLTFKYGDDPHTIIEVEEKINYFPDLKKNQYIVASVKPEIKLTESALHYSDYLTVINNSSPKSIEQIPNEGYFCAKILSATKNITGADGHPILGTGKFVVKGLLDTSNIFAGDKVTIKNSAQNVGTYIISNLQYDFIKEETTLTVNENVRGNYTNNTTLDIIYCSANAEQCEELAEFEIPANVIIIDGDYTSRFIQGKRFEIADGTLAGEYLTHSSRFINGKTNIRTTATLIDKNHGYNIVDVKEHVNKNNDIYTIVVSGDRRDYFKEGSHFNIIDSKGNDGFFQVASPGSFLSSTTAACANSNSIISDTEIPVFGNLKKMAGGSAIPFKKGEILDRFYGYSEYEEWCNHIPYTLVKVKIDETLDILGDSMFFKEDVIAYDLENNDKLGYELYEKIIFSKNEPSISIAPIEPTNNDEIWYDISKDTPSKDRLKKRMTNYKNNTLEWVPMNSENTAWWIKTKDITINKKTITEYRELYFRRFNLDKVKSDGTIVVKDSGWVMDLPKGPNSPVTPGYNLIQAARGDFLLQSSGSIIAENSGDGVTAHKVYEIKPHHGVKMHRGDDFTIGKDIYHTGSKAIPDRRLIKVRVNNVPALWCFDEIRPIKGKPDEFNVRIEIKKPHVRIGDIIDFEIFKRVEKDWQHNAHVFSYDRTPHSFFHEYVEVRKGDIKSSAEENHGAYVIGGGNFIKKFNEFTEFKMHSPNRILIMERVKTFPIIMTDHINNEIAIFGNYTWLFKSNHIFVAQLSEFSYIEYEVERSIYNGRYTLIKVKHDGPGSIFDDPIFYKNPIDTLEIDSTLKTIIIKCDWSEAIFEGDKIKITNSGKGNDGTYTINQVAYDFAMDRTDIKVIENISKNEIGGPAKLILPVEAGEKSRNIIGAVYNPEKTDMPDSDCTLIVPNTRVDENVYKIEYTYPGPVNFATEYGVHDIEIKSLTNHKITIRAGGKKSTKVDIKDPTKSTFKDPILTLVNELKPGNIFRLKFSSGFYGCSDKNENNDGAYVVKKVTDSPITGITPSLPETTIEVEYDYAAFPPYGKYLIKSMTKKPGIGSVIIFDKDIRKIFESLAYNKFFIKTVEHKSRARAKQNRPLINANEYKNYATIIQVSYNAIWQETTVIIRETVKGEINSPQEIEMVDWLFAPGILCDANTPKKADVWNKGIIVWEDHSLAKNFAQDERLAKAVITEQLGFTWGNEYEDEPESLIDFSAKINLIDPIRNVIILEEGNPLIQKGQKIKIENTINNNSIFTVEESSIFDNTPYIKIEEVLAYGTINIINMINNNTFEVKSSLRKKLKVGEYCLIDNKEYKVKKITYNKPNSIIEVENSIHKIENKEVWFTEKCGKISNGE